MLSAYAECRLVNHHSHDQPKLIATNLKPTRHPVLHQKLRVRLTGSLCSVVHLSGANVVRHACLLDPCPRCHLSRAEDDALRHRHSLTVVESDPAFA